MHDDREKTQKEIRILEAAESLFGRFGLKKTSIEEIARTAGLGKGTIYLYFKSKEDIFAAVVSRFGKALSDTLQREVDAAVGPEAKLETFIVTRMRYVFAALRQNEVTAEVLQETSNVAAVQTWKQAISSEQIAVLKNIIEAGQAAGDFDEGDAEVSAMAIYAAIESMEKPWSFQGRELGHEDKLKALINLYLHGLKKRNNLKRNELR